jgi:hypothetical protein
MEEGLMDEKGNMIGVKAFTWIDQTRISWMGRMSSLLSARVSERWRM